MLNGKCSKNFPKAFAVKTYAGNDSYPVYQWWDNGRHIVKNGVRLDNRYAVPYNPYLSKKYNAHINVEICSSITSCKYLYKYVYKGPDMAAVAVHPQDPRSKDEIKKFENACFITASEGMWRFFGFDIHG